MQYCWHHDDAQNFKPWKKWENTRNLYLHWKVKWTTTTKRIYPQEISFNCLSSKRMEKISTCVLPSIKNHHLSNMKPRFRGFCWMIWNCRFGLISVTFLRLNPTYFVLLLFYIECQICWFSWRKCFVFQKSLSK